MLVNGFLNICAIFGTILQGLVRFVQPMFRSDNWPQILPFNFKQLQCFQGDFFVICSHSSHTVADIQDFSFTTFCTGFGQRNFIFRNGQDAKAILGAGFVSGNHGVNPHQRLSLFRINALDPGMRIRTSQNLPDQHAR